jgi:hypothetical protein
MPDTPAEQPSQQAAEPSQGAAAKPPWLGTTAQHCQEMVDRATSRNMMVKFMLEKMEQVRRHQLPSPVWRWQLVHSSYGLACLTSQLRPSSQRILLSTPAVRLPRPPASPCLCVQAGCGVGKDFVQIEHCDAEVGGGFRPPDGVIICHNHLASQVPQPFINLSALSGA